MIDLDEKVTSEAKREEIGQILRNPHPPHIQRVWMVGFLRYCGYSESEVCKLISENNSWLDYVKSVTERQVSSIFKSPRKCPHQREAHSSRSRSELTLDSMIISFLKGTKPINLDIPLEPYDAAIYYHENHFTVLPKHKSEKRPMFDWAAFQSRKPCLSEIKSWNWNYGICLLANGDYSFLDVDKNGYGHLFSGRHVEKTPRGGLHVFGKGIMRSQVVIGGEIKGIGTLIVTSPTPGYEVIYK